MAALAYPYIRPSRRGGAAGAPRLAGAAAGQLWVVSDEALATRRAPAGPPARAARAAHRPAAVAPRAVTATIPHRLAAAVVILGALLAAWLGAGALAGAGSGQHDVRLPGSIPVRGGYAYVVRPGDTLWSIATRVDPSGDPRPLVDRLSTEVGGGSLQPGSVIVVP